MNDQPGMRIDITIDDGFEPGPRTTTAITELIDALHDEHPTDDVTGYTTPTLRNLTFNFASTAGTSPSSLTAPNPPSTRFGSSAGGSPNV